MSLLDLTQLRFASSSYFYDYSRLTPYLNPPTNYIGAALFQSYAFLALILTTGITVSLYRRYQSLINFPLLSSTIPPTRQIRNARARHIKIYAGIASISFAILSYHMLNFLVANYEQWNGYSGQESNWGTKAIWAVIKEGKLRDWMLESSLFESFARQLVDDGPSTVWMQLGVLGTWFWGVWMSGKASERGFSTKQILSYILLAQILPISFTVALFLVHLHLASPDLAPSTTPTPEIDNLAAQKSEAEITHEQSQASSPIHRKTSLLLPTILLNVVLLSLAPLRKQPQFIPLVLSIRLLLLLPYTGRISTRSVEVDRCIVVSAGFVMGNLMVLKKGYGLGDVLGVLRGGEYGGSAVQTLAWDGMLGMVVGRVVAWGGGV